MLIEVAEKSYHVNRRLSGNDIYDNLFPHDAINDSNTMQGLATTYKYSLDT